MKILQLCKKFPYPLKDGESMAVTYLSRGLRRVGASVDLLSMNTTKHWVDPDSIPEDFDHYGRIRLIPVDNRLRWQDALISLIKGESYHISRFVQSGYREALQQMLAEEAYDVVLIESVHLMPYASVVKAHSRARVALRAHNVEYLIWERVTRQEKNLLKRIYLRTLTRQLRKYEESALGEADLLVPISPEDGRIFRVSGYSGPMHVSPVGMELSRFAYTECRGKDLHELRFIGSLDWIPNQEGIRWLLETAWPQVRRRYPDTIIYIAGRHAPTWLRKLHSADIQVMGEVPSSRAFLLGGELMIVPLLSGSGIRVKILEAMALGRVVITTQIGIEGIPARDKVQCLIANTPEEIVEAIAYCRENPGHMISMSREARAFIERHYDADEIARELAHRLAGH